MRNSDITETIATEIERKFYGEWKHEGLILGCSSRHINFEVDGKEYILVLHEVCNGKHFTDYLVANDSDPTVLTDEIREEYRKRIREICGRNVCIKCPLCVENSPCCENVTADFSDDQLVRAIRIIEGANK